MSVVRRGRERRKRKKRSVGGDVRRIWESKKTNLFFSTFLGIAKYSFSVSFMAMF